MLCIYNLITYANTPFVCGLYKTFGLTLRFYIFERDFWVILRPITPSKTSKLYLSTHLTLGDKS